MPARFLRRALVALIVYYCVVGIFQFSPWLTDKIKPYLSPVLTESIGFAKVKSVVADLLSYSVTSQPGYLETSDVENQMTSVTQQGARVELPAP